MTPLVAEMWDPDTSEWRTFQTPPDPDALPYDWSPTNLPWDEQPEAWETKLPAGVPVVDLDLNAPTFREQLDRTLEAQSGRVIVRLGSGVHTLTEFTPIGVSGDPTYAFGYWSPRLAGFIGAGADVCIIEMGPNAVSQAQLDKMASIPKAAFAPLQMGLIRFDTQWNGTPAPIYLGGVTFEAAPQPLLKSVASDITDIYVPQSAPHQGVVIYSGSSRRHPDSIITHCRFRGAGKAMMSQPPFEMANLTSQRNHILHDRCEFDGRMSPRYNPDQPRKCGPVMVNGGVNITFRDCWLHDSNVSRWAANDESVESPEALSINYRLERCKLERISNNENRQPGVNDGQPLGGLTNVSCVGWESSNARCEVIDCIMSQDNPRKAGQTPMHLQFTNTVGARQGGRCYVVGGRWSNTGFPIVDGYLTFRILKSTHWWTDGLDTTIDVRTAEGARKIPLVFDGGTWPPTAEQLVGASPNTHYIVRTN